MDKKDRIILFSRCIAGAVGYTAIVFAISMVPLVIQMTIYNMAPFWTFFLGWLVLGEKMNLFEVLALFGSFFSSELAQLLCVHS